MAELSHPHPIAGGALSPRSRLTGGRPLPIVEQRLRLVFPDLWARYEALMAARDLDAPARRARPRPIAPLLS